MSSSSTFPSSDFTRLIGATGFFRLIDLRTDDAFSLSEAGSATASSRRGERIALSKRGWSLFGWMSLCLDRSVERRALLELTDDQLTDIGLTRDMARSEARRWPWVGLDEAR